MADKESMWPVEIEKLKTQIQRQVEACGARFVDFTVRRGSHRSFLTVIVDKPEGIKLDECAEINKRLGEHLDRLAGESDGYEFLKGSYYLEVNSPGLDRPLKTREDFERVLGKAIRLLWQNERGISVWVEGRLRAVGENSLELDLEPGRETKEFPLEKIVRAMRQVQFS